MTHQPLQAYQTHPVVQQQGSVGMPQPVGRNPLHPREFIRQAPQAPPNSFARHHLLIRNHCQLPILPQIAGGVVLLLPFDVPPHRRHVLLAQREGSVGALPLEELPRRDLVGYQVERRALHPLSQLGHRHRGVQPHQQMHVIIGTANSQRHTLELTALRRDAGIQARLDGFGD